jgi:hypothetical protein
MSAKPDAEATARFWRGLRNALNTPPEKPRKRKGRRKGKRR